MTKSLKNKRLQVVSPKTQTSLEVYSSFYLDHQVVREWSKGHNSYKNKAKVRAYNRIITILRAKGYKDMFSKTEYINALVNIAAHNKSWLNEPEYWHKFTGAQRWEWERSILGKAESTIAEMKIWDLIHYLFGKYPVPVFLENAFFKPDTTHTEWCIRLARGESLHKTVIFPLSMTTKMVHYFLQAPDNYSVIEALRCGQVMGMGGDARLLKEILASRLGQNIENEAFWETVIRFFVQNPMLDTWQIRPIIDFLQSEKFETRRVITQLGRMEELPPANPNFSMKGRTSFSILRLLNEWHERLNEEREFRRYNKNSAWFGLPIKDYEEKFRSKEGRKTFQIKQLCNYHELSEEGKIMRHCVLSYADSCEEERTSIWSMREKIADDDYVRLVTIEVRADKSIVQIRGFANRLPDENEMAPIRMWANNEGLTLNGRY